MLEFSLDLPPAAVCAKLVDACLKERRGFTTSLCDTTCAYSLRSIGDLYIADNDLL
jgi:hypothetical protein